VRRELGLPPIENGDVMYVGPNMQTPTGGSDAEAGNEVSDEVVGNDVSE